LVIINYWLLVALFQILFPQFWINCCPVLQGRGLVITYTAAVLNRWLQARLPGPHQSTYATEENICHKMPVNC